MKNELSLKGTVGAEKGYKEREDCHEMDFTSLNFSYSLSKSSSREISAWIPTPPIPSTRANP